MTLRDRAKTQLRLAAIRSELDSLTHDLHAIGLPWAAQESRLVAQVNRLTEVIESILDHLPTT